MEFNNVRKGISNAKFNEENSKILFGEVALISLFIGLGTQSWWWGGGVFISFLVALQIKPIAIFLMVVLSLAWGGIGYGIGTLFESTGAMVVLAGLGFFIGLGVHLSGLEWSQDISQ
ncbi:hypothetical protein [Shewanella litoralis]|uniref:Uncharacterized protein n=1 Tax=Shewanella litoralis TaxID=2282700 RepID=A0ABQ2R170_9GAMM|nr:hypothetical protein [Shewanella litoralis]GGQ06319.1 hypothetical protein GCM10009411_04010 [Shewanella litoralis]